MKKADKPAVVINGNNNKVSIGGTNLLPIAIVAFALGALAIVVLAISLCCPELLADFIRWIVGTAINS